MSTSSATATDFLPASLASSNPHHLSELVATITTADIDSADLCGGGAFGDVYALNHPTIGKLALKRVRTSGNQQQVTAQLRRSTREAEMWRQLAHPNVLPFLDILERAGFVYLVSPFVENGSLVDFIQTHPDVDRIPLIQVQRPGLRTFINVELCMAT